MGEWSQTFWHLKRTSRVERKTQQGTDPDGQLKNKNFFHSTHNAHHVKVRQFPDMLFTSYKKTVYVAVTVYNTICKNLNADRLHIDS